MHDPLKSINPYTGETLSTYPQLSDEIVNHRLERSDKRFRKWSTTRMEDRVALIGKLGEAIKEAKRNLAELATLEMGKPLSQAIAEVEKCAWLCSHYAENAGNYLEDQKIDTDADESWVAYEPLGVILGVMPWNFPYWQVMRFAVPTLLAGNTVAIKHASNTTGCVNALADVFERAGFEEGCFEVLIVEGSRVKSIIGSEFVKAVSLTGSEKAGASVAAAAGKHLKKTVLELGGSNAFIVLADADLGEAAKIGVKARIQNNGQSCIAAKRFLVEDSVYDDFMERFLEKWEKLKVGNPMETGTDVGPLARLDLAETLDEQMRRSMDQRAKLLRGGSRQGPLFEPAILEGVKPGMAAFDEETFGPLAAFTRIKDAEEAVELNNRSRYGLGATLFTSDLERGKRLGRSIRDGAVFFNEMVKSDPRLPFGGTKISGYGRELGPFGIKEFTNVKTYYKV